MILDHNSARVVAIATDRFPADPVALTSVGNRPTHTWVQPIVEAPNVTPLTELLVMVIIVMVTTLAKVEQTREEQTQVTQQSEQTDQVKRSGLELTLPQSAEQEIDTSRASLVLMIPIQGDVEIGGKAMHDADIDAVFAAAFQRDKGTQLTLKADKRVPHAKVVDLMERAKGAGLTHLAIATGGWGSGS